MAGCYFITLQESTQAAAWVGLLAAPTARVLREFRPQERAQCHPKREAGDPKKGAVLPQEGSREDRVRAAPAVSRAKCRRNAHEHTGSAEAVRPSLRNGVTVSFVLSSVNGLLATVIPKKLASQGLDASIAASGPHDFAVRDQPRSSVVAIPSTASHRTFVTIASRPSIGWDGLWKT